MTTAGEIIAALGGNPENGMCRCPSHPDHRPSLSVTERDGKILVHCFRCSQNAVIEALRQRGLWKNGGTRPLPGESKFKPKEREPKSAETARELLRLWEASPERPGEYLNGRGLTMVPRCLRVANAAQMKASAGRLLPAMLAPVSRGDQTIGVHATFLTLDRRRNAIKDGKSFRRSYGRVAGGLIMLRRFQPQQPAVLGEGIETTLTVMQVLDLPGAATVYAGNVPQALPACAEVILAADADPAGMTGARKIADALARNGHKVRVVAPDSGDWNDTIREEMRHVG